MRKIISVILACLACSLFISPTVANQRKSARVQITGVYSSMRYVEEAGDVVGMEIFLVAGGDGYYASVQIAEGVPDPPVVVKVEVKGSALNLRSRIVQGRTSANLLGGFLPEVSQEDFRMRRKQSF